MIMTNYKKLTLDSPSYNFHQCINYINETFTKLTKLQRYYISLWWCGKLPKFLRPLVEKLLYRDY